MSRDSYERLAEALDQAREAKDCIGQNRGYEKEQAREAYEYTVSEMGRPLLKAIEDACGDLEAKDVEAIAAFVLQRLERRRLL